MATRIADTGADAGRTAPKTPDLVDQFTDLVLGGNEPRRLAEQTLGIVLTLTRGRCAAAFAVEDGRLVLSASHGLDQAALDAAHADWAAHGQALSRGAVIETPEAQGGRARVTASIRAGDRLVGLLYVDGAEAFDEDGRRRLSKFSAILARALEAPSPAADRPGGWERNVEPSPADGLERERLLMLLERNEWNIARVARILGVTRRTIYLRLARYRLPREHVRKAE